MDAARDRLAPSPARIVCVSSGVLSAASFVARRARAPRRHGRRVRGAGRQPRLARPPGGHRAHAAPVAPPRDRGRGAGRRGGPRRGGGRPLARGGAGASARRRAHGGPHRGAGHDRLRGRAAHPPASRPGMGRGRRARDQPGGRAPRRARGAARRSRLRRGGDPADLRPRGVGRPAGGGRRHGRPRAPPRARRRRHARARHPHLPQLARRRADPCRPVRGGAGRQDRPHRSGQDPADLPGKIRRTWEAGEQDARRFLAEIDPARPERAGPDDTITEGGET